MFCPRCSQPQASEGARFCPRCGLQLDAAQALVAGSQDAVAPARDAADRKRDVLLGATLMLVGALAVALLAVSEVAPTPVQAVAIPLLLVWGAVVSALLLWGHAVREVRRLFCRDAPEPRPAEPSDLATRVGAAARQQALPPATAAPAPGPGSWRVSTAELVPAPSVTERTTNLLNKS